MEQQTTSALAEGAVNGIVDANNMTSIQTTGRERRVCMMSRTNGFDLKPSHARTRLTMEANHHSGTILIVPL